MYTSLELCGIILEFTPSSIVFYLGMKVEIGAHDIRSRFTPRNLPINDALTFASMAKLTSTIVEYGQRETLKIFKNKPCILQLLGGIELTPELSEVGNLFLANPVLLNDSKLYCNIPRIHTHPIYSLIE